MAPEQKDVQRQAMGAQQKAQQEAMKRQQDEMTVIITAYVRVC
jgi:hypothetical protein